MDRHYDHESAERLFHAALEKPRDERVRFVFESCDLRYSLFRDVMSLLQWHDRTGVLDVAPDSGPVTLPDVELSGDMATSLGTYRIIKRLGDGGMGRVYLAEQMEPIRRRVALKVIKHTVDSSAAAARFAVERQVLSLMNHPGIAAVYELGALRDGRLFFAMEYVDGQAIDLYCRTHSLSVRDCLELLVTVCSAVEHAHRRGVVHRDLKMSNILVTDTDGRPTAKVIDFGVSKVIHQTAAHQLTATIQGTVVGSLSYMSPEQADHRIMDVDTRSDVYSLGVVLCELITGRNPLGLDARALPPFEEAVRRIREEPPIRASTLHQQNGSPSLFEMSSRTLRMLREDLDWIILRALEKERSRRYQTVSDFSADIQRALNHEPTTARPPSAVYRARKFVRRNRLFVSFATIAVLALLVGAITSAALLARNKKLKQVAQEQRDELLDLTMVKEVAACISRADSLMAPDPARVNDMLETLSQAGRLAQRLPDLTARLMVLRMKSDRRVVGEFAAHGSRTGSDRYEFNDQELQFQHDVLAKVVAGLEHIDNVDPRTGVISGLKHRIELAKTLRHESIERYKKQWDEAIAAISDTLLFPVYSGLRIAPQAGLIPLGADPASGLYEFHVLHSGEMARRNDEGQLEIDGATGIVMILIPPGCFYMGATRDKADHPGIIRDRNARHYETPPQRVCLDPFFISKYELTQGQWTIVNVTNPSMVDWKFIGLNYPMTTLHPVDNVTWHEADRAARAFGLDLPTEAQWEYAARAGTVTPWGEGDTPDDLRWYANLRDQSYNEFVDLESSRSHEWRDGYGGTAPVGRFRANGFGLHDTMGNVWEWTRGPAGSYTDPVRTGDGLRLSNSPLKAVRSPGIGFAYPHARITRRLRFATDYRVAIGVRPARAVYDGDGDGQAAR